jgi:hypothetical protein
MRVLLLIIVLSTVAAIGCTDKEALGQTLYNEALTADRDGHVEQAEVLLTKVISDFPKTQVATDANDTLNRMKAAAEVRSTNESTAVAAIRVLNTANVTFLGLYGRYPANLEDLVQAGLVSTKLLDVSSGYRLKLSLRANACDLYAEPISTSTGRRFFYTSSDDFSIRYRNGQPADRGSPTIK